VEIKSILSSPTAEFLYAVWVKMGHLSCFGTLHCYFVFDLLTFLKYPVSSRCDVCVMDEHILTAVFRNDKTVPLLIVEPLYCTNSRTYSRSTYYMNICIMLTCFPEKFCAYSSNKNYFPGSVQNISHFLSGVVLGTGFGFCF